MEQLKRKLIEDFKKTVPKDEEKLISEYEKYIEAMIEDIKKSSDQEEMEASIEVAKIMAGRLINADIDTKKRRLFRDENLSKLEATSMDAYRMAEQIVEGKKQIRKISKDEVDEKIKQMEELAKKVQPYNVEQARILLSEGIMDLRYITGEEKEIVSLRLGHVFQRLRREEARRREQGGEEK
ncbi:MAG: hypothetical protein IKP28_04465 [Clostridia bacterium]|nr:hypothetical protein [Clostridia bacterium]